MWYNAENNALGGEKENKKNWAETIYGDLGDLAEFGKKPTQIMIFVPHYMWAENKK